MGPKSKNEKRKGALARMERGKVSGLDKRVKKNPRTEEQRQHEMEILRKVMQ